MATFTYAPDWGASPELEPGLRSVRFGDGYEQRATNGLNPILPTWKLQFTKRTQAEAQAIYSWMVANNAQVTAFDWAAPGEGVAAGELFGTGDGTRVTYSLVALSRPCTVVGTPTIYRTDWQGTYQLSATARTNLLTFSEQFDNASWLKSNGGVGVAPAVTPNAGAGPDGNSTADRVVFDIAAGTTSTDLSQLQHTTTSIPLGTPGNSSLWIKSNTGSSYQLILSCPDGTVNKLVTAGPTWARVDSGSSGTAATTGGLRLRLWGNEGTSKFADILVACAQVETNLTPTRYIPTTTAAVTVTDYSINSAGLVTLASTTNPVAAQSLGTASGSTATFAVVTPNGSTPTVLNVWRTDWQGRQKMYPTSRTNYVFKSADLSTTWGKLNVVVTADAATAPDGTTTADKMADNATLGYHIATSNAYADIPVASSSLVCASTYFRNVDAQFGVVQIGTRVPLYPKVIFDLVNGTMVAVGPLVAYGMQDVGNGWWRCWIVANAGTGASPLGMVVGVDASGTSTTYSGTGKSIYFWGAQFEAGTAPTSYIPTTTAAVTVTDWSQSGSNVVFASNPLAGSLIEADYTYTGGLGVGNTVTWTGSYTRKHVAKFGVPKPDGFNSWSITADFREVPA